VVLWFLILVVFASYWVIYFTYFPEPVDQTELVKRIYAMEYEKDLPKAGKREVFSGKNSEVEFSEEQVSVTLPKQVPFDPNTASIDQLVEVGIPTFLAKRIDKYRAKGGEFRTRKDLVRIYGFSDSLYRSLKPLITLPDTLPKKRYPRSSKSNYTHKPDEVIAKPLEMNSADADTWMEIRGIGPGYSRRILKYRDLLGGYYKPDQLLEVYGFPDSLYQVISDRLKIDSSQIRQININYASAYELSKHPYITWNMGLIIENYRKEEGLFDHPVDLVNKGLLNELLYAKIAAYLTAADTSVLEPSAP